MISLDSGFFPKNEAVYYESPIKDMRASASQSIIENVNALEAFRSANAFRIWQRLEKELLGPRG